MSIYFLVTDCKEPRRWDCRFHLRMHSSSDGPGEIILYQVLKHFLTVLFVTWEFPTSLITHIDLHWLAIPQRIQYKLGLTVHRHLQHKSLKYLMDCCTLVSDVASRWRLRSVSSQHVWSSVFLSLSVLFPLSSTWPHLNSDVGMEEGEY